MDGPVAFRLVNAAVTAVSIMFLGITICMASVPGTLSKGRDIAELGKPAGVPACTMCHGPDLRGSAGIGAHSIAGKPAAFILARLDHYAGPDGHNPVMRQVATALTSTDREAVAGILGDGEAGRSKVAAGKTAVARCLRGRGAYRRGIRRVDPLPPTTQAKGIPPYRLSGLAI